MIVSMKRRCGNGLALFFVVLLAGCTTNISSTTDADRAGTAPQIQIRDCDRGALWTEFRTYFGRSIPGGGEVSDDDWRRFTDEVITPRFPEGFTVLDARGFWDDSERRETISEKSKLLVVLAKDAAEAARKVEEVANVYIARFRQQAVASTESEACTTFYE